MESGQVCPKCGTSCNVSAETADQSGVVFAENTAGILCYLLGWITGIVFFIVDKRPFVRFHAAQSIVAFGALSVLTFVLNRVFLLFPYVFWSLFSMINTLIVLGSVALAVFLMLQAHKGERYPLPIAGPYAEKLEKNIESVIQKL